MKQFQPVIQPSITYACSYLCLLFHIQLSSFQTLFQPCFIEISTFVHHKYYYFDFPILLFLSMSAHTSLAFLYLTNYLYLLSSQTLLKMVLLYFSRHLCCINSDDLPFYVKRIGTPGEIGNFIKLSFVFVLNTSNCVISFLSTA